MVNVGPLEMLLVAVIALIVLGPARLPEVARSVGRGMREFRSALSSAGEDDSSDDDEDDEIPAQDDEIPAIDDEVLDPAEATAEPAEEADLPERS